MRKMLVAGLFGTKSEHATLPHMAMAHRVVSGWKAYKKNWPRKIRQDILITQEKELPCHDLKNWNSSLVIYLISVWVAYPQPFYFFHPPPGGSEPFRFGYRTSAK